jgi:hypothetical protein
LLSVLGDLEGQRAVERKKENWNPDLSGKSNLIEEKSIESQMTMHPQLLIPQLQQDAAPNPVSRVFVAGFAPSAVLVVFTSNLLPLDWRA